MAAKHWRVWATRPRAQNSAWAERLSQEGYRVLELPLIDIVPLTDPSSQQAIKNLILDFDQFNAVIFVSQNAVEHGFEWIHNYWPQLPVGLDYYAVGSKTAQAVSAQGVEVWQGDSTMDTEALLSLPQLHDVWGKKILICRGRGGLPKLGQILHQRGAMVRYLELYERLLPAGVIDELQSRVNALGADDLLVAFSGETLQNLLSALTDAGFSAWNNPLLVPGKRLEELAQALGFTQVISAANASESAMLAALAQFSEQHLPHSQDLS